MAFTDDFNRTTLNVAATKSAGNPEIGSDYADPSIYYEGGIYYIFAVDQTNKNIVYFTSTDLATFSGATTILNKGGGGTWDAYKVADPSILQVGGTYYLFYAGQQAAGTGTTWKIGYATASSITGTYTKYGSNPVITHASAGVNECSVDYDPNRTPKWQTFVTSGTTGNIDDVGDGDIRRFTASTPDGTWTDQGVVLATPYQDQQQVMDGETMVMQLNSGGDIVQMVSPDKGATWQPIRSGNILTHSGAGFETSAIYAPAILQQVDGTWVIFYQGVNVSDSQLGYATIPKLHRWYPTDTDCFEMINYLHTTTPAPVAWNCCQSEYAYTPAGVGYTVQCDVYAESQADTGIYTHGLVIAWNGTLVYSVVVNASGPKLSLYSGSSVTSPTDTNLGDNTGLTMGLSAWRTIRARVTSTTINIDWYDGTTWNQNALTASGLSLIAARPGPLAYSPTGNQSRFRNYTIRATGSQSVTSIAGVYALSGTSSLFRVGSPLYLRYRK